MKNKLYVCFKYYIDLKLKKFILARSTSNKLFLTFKYCAHERL